MNPGPDAAQWYANNIAITAAVISIFGVVINALIAYLAVSQSKAAQVSADAAQESVAAANKSVEQAKDALEIANRAWVHVKGLFHYINQPGQVAHVTVRADVVLQNYGPTPAVAFMAEGHLALFPDFPKTEELQFNLTDKNGVSVVSASNEFRLPTAFIALTLDQWSLVESGQKKLVLFGRAHYEDIFRKPHKSTWLYWYDTGKAQQFVVGPFHNYVT